jgi:L-lactate dehydrogenase complex protein LldF
LFVTCLTDTLYPQTGKSVVRVLERLGHEVAFPMRQTCCGQLFLNTGYRDQTLPLVRGFAAAFAEFDAIVTPSASCAAMVREYHPRLAAESGDAGLAHVVDDLVPRVHELSVLLADVLGVTDVGASFPLRVTYHPSCHSLRMLRIGDAQLRLLRAVRGIDLAELPAADVCCGFGGTFSVKNQDVSAAMCADKCAAVVSTGAQVLCAADSSCLMHIGGGLRRQRAAVTTMHLAEILASTAGPAGRRISTPAYLGMPSFPEAAADALADPRVRGNLSRATGTIRSKRAAAVAELADWAELRAAAKAIKDHALAHLDHYLLQLEGKVTAAGGHVHWASSAAEANALVASLTRAAGADRVVKVKSMATQETGLNEALAAAGITAIETDLAELIVQLGQDKPSQILVPAIHRNRAEIQEIFRRQMPDAPAGLTDDPAELAAAARTHLRRAFLSATVGVSGANFAIAETGSLVVLESEGNGRICLTLPQTLISVVGIEKLLPAWRDLEVFLALLPRSSTAERMNPYTSTWTGVTPGDGPRDFHLVLLDNGRTTALADRTGRQALRCIRCSACLNVCPVYERVGGHAYGSPYPGPIGAILTPQLRGMSSAADRALPYASSLCGACYEVCPVAINIPQALVRLRGQAVDSRPRAPFDLERLALGAAAWTLRDPRRLAFAQGAASASGRLLNAAGPQPGPGGCHCWATGPGPGRRRPCRPNRSAPGGPVALPRRPRP